VTSLKNIIKPFFYRLLESSIDRAAKRQGLSNLIGRLYDSVPNVTEQYTTFKINSSYLTKKIRAEHAFQISLAIKAIEWLDKEHCNIVDIGDSAGTHIQYLQSLFPDKVTAVSVNIDETAIIKIRDKGLRAIHARAEELTGRSTSATLPLRQPSIVTDPAWVYPSNT